jgi:hypothetical protein
MAVYRPAMSHPTSPATQTRLLCIGYTVIAAVALAATWSQNVAYFHSPTGLLTFWSDTKVNPASRSITVDIVLFFLAAAIFMVVEARKHAIPYVWAYLLGGALIAISVTFPLFLIARQLRVGPSETTRLGAVDATILAVLSVLTIAFVIWVDVA